MLYPSPGLARGSFFLRLNQIGPKKKLSTLKILWRCKMKHDLIDLSGIGLCILGAVLIIWSNVDLAVKLQTHGIVILALGFAVLFAHVGYQIIRSERRKP